MRMKICLLLFSASLIGQPAIAGDNLTIPGHVVSSTKQDMPSRGTRMEAVLSEFGEPNERIGPVGEPPITHWDYGTFKVYFEYEIVLHTVDLNTLIIPQ